MPWKHLREEARIQMKGFTEVERYEENQGEMDGMIEVEE